MQVRCSNDGSTFDVPDEFAGRKVNCPQCGFPLTVGRPSDGIQASAPTPRSAVPADIENHIYDGLPPLSVMIALRRGKGPAYDDDDFVQRYPMTEDDWKALAAFESVLYAVAAGRFASTLCLLATLVNFAAMFLAYRAGTSQAWMHDLYFLSVCGVMLLFLIGQAILGIATGELDEVRHSRAVRWVLFATLGSAFLLGIAAAAHLCFAFADPHSAGSAFIVLLAVTISVVSAVDLVKTSIRINRALKQIEPPEITTRLVEALKCLNVREE